MAQQQSFHSACRMGAWIIDMADLDAAHAAIACCKAEIDPDIEVRHTLWGVQVRTDDQAVADWLAAHYTPSAVALAA